MHYLLLILLLLTTSAFARIINIPNDFETIQAGIDEAEDGDTVLVAPGEYVENINFEGKSILLVSRYILDQSLNSIDSTIIDGGEDGSTILFENGEDECTALIGFTITNGSGLLDGHDDICGGGIYCRNNSSPRLENLYVFNNRAHFGGGICIQGSSPLIKHLRIYSNSATYSGGGIHISHNSSPVIMYTDIYNNTCNLTGGGINLYNSSRPILTNTTIFGNRSERNTMGAVSIKWNCHPIFDNCVIWDNGQSPIGLGFDGAPWPGITIGYSDLEGGDLPPKHVPVSKLLLPGLPGCIPEGKA